MKFQAALATAAEHVLRPVETPQGHMAVCVAGEWFTVHGAAVTPYDGREKLTEPKTGQPED